MYVCTLDHLCNMACKHFRGILAIKKKKEKKVLLTSHYSAFFIIYKGKGSLLTSLIISLCTHP